MVTDEHAALDLGEAAVSPSALPTVGSGPPANVVAVLVLVLGLLITLGVTWGAQTQYADAESRLVLVQTKQAGAVLLASIPSTQQPLVVAGQLARATGGSVADFRGYMHPLSGDGGFLATSLWFVHDDHVTVLTSHGASGSFGLSHSATSRLAASAISAPSFVVVGLPRRQPRAIGYALATKAAGGAYVVFVERSIPKDRRSRVATGNSAFSELHYAIYLGSAVTPGALLTTDFAAGTPTSGTDKTTVPFGNTELTLVTAPIDSLAGALPGELPWILAVGGVVLSVAAALLARRLVHQRRDAERAANEITVLHHELSGLYQEQRTIALTLQRSLLPIRTPEVAGLEIGVRYIPGSEGVEIGGDWYSVVAVDDTHFAFVVGDVSGRGVRAATVMAALRFTIRTLLLEGISPPTVLEKCAAQTRDLVTDHLATVLVGVGDLATGTVVLANAGHLPPLQLLEDGSASFLDTAVGVPIGAPGGAYRATTVSTPAGSTLLLYTDGLIERRGEGLGVGLERLAAVARRAPRDLEGFLTSVCEELTQGSDEDDVAMLALRWLPAVANR